MNPCTIMGGFWFEAGRCLFGLAVFGGLIVALFGGALLWVTIGSVLHRFKHATSKTGAEQ